MNLSEPLDGLTSAVESAVLRVLARSDAGFSGRQVRSLADVGSTSSVQRALTSFVKLGLVTSELRPPAIIYRANREHVLWPTIDAALSARNRAFESIAAFCADLLPAELPEDSHLTVIVYGSVARRDSTSDSDLDLFIAYPDGFDNDARAEINYQIASYAERLTGNDVQVLSIPRSEIADRIVEHDLLIENIVADGILVFGPPLLPGVSRVA